jgi:hypothetical protein
MTTPVPQVVRSHINIVREYVILLWCEILLSDWHLLDCVDAESRRNWR